jgi:hypothetical protein
MNDLRLMATMCADHLSIAAVCRLTMVTNLPSTASKDVQMKHSVPLKAIIVLIALGIQASSTLILQQ